MVPILPMEVGYYGRDGFPYYGYQYGSGYSYGQGFGYASARFGFYGGRYSYGQWVWIFQPLLRPRCCWTGAILPPRRCSCTTTTMAKVLLDRRITTSQEVLLHRGMDIPSTIMAKAVWLDRRPTTSQEVLLHWVMDIPSTIMAKVVLLDTRPNTSQEVFLHWGMDIPSTITSRGGGGGGGGLWKCGICTGSPWHWTTASLLSLLLLLQQWK